MGRKILTAISLWVTAIGVLVGAWVFSPGYVAPLYNHPIARLVIVGMLFLHTCACISYGVVESLNLPAILRIVPILLCIFTTTAMVLVPTLGPAVITIMCALGPLAH